MFAAATTLGFQLPVPVDSFKPDCHSVDATHLCGCMNGAITFDLSIAGFILCNLCSLCFALVWLCCLLLCWYYYSSYLLLLVFRMNLSI
jgi:hypothetical protein